MDKVCELKKYTFDELYVGLEEQFEITVTTEMQDCFGRICGDYSPIHVDAEAAKKAGFESRVVYGMLTSSLYSTLVGMLLPGERALLQSVNTKLTKPVYEGDKLIVKGKITEKNDSCLLIRIRGDIIKSTGEKVSRAEMQVGVRTE